MRKLTVLFAGLLLTAMIGATSGAQAHTTQQCLTELRTYSTLCKLSPTAWLSGMCKNKKVQAWCGNKKLHQEKFHEN